MPEAKLTSSQEFPRVVPPSVEKCAFFRKRDKCFALVPPFSVQTKYLYIFKLSLI
jgi:hypothetical protein